MNWDLPTPFTTELSVGADDIDGLLPGWSAVPGATHSN